MNDTPFFSYDRRLTEKAQENRGQPTNAERIFWYEILRDKKTGYKFIRQKPIDHFIVDFYCSKLRLAIEVDGDSHAAQEGYDAERTTILEGHGIRVIRYANKDVSNNIDSVYKDLMERINERKREIE